MADGTDPRCDMCLNARYRPPAMTETRKLAGDSPHRHLTLSSGQGVVKPRTVEHRTRAPQKTVVLVVENKQALPTEAQRRGDLG